MGEVSTVLISPEDMTFGPNSFYIDVEQTAQERARLHIAETMKPAEFARQVADSILSNPALRKCEYVWKGTRAVLAWFLNTMGFRKIFDSTVEGAVGPNKTEMRKAVFDRGRRSVERK